MNEEQKSRIKAKYKLIVDNLEFDDVQDFLYSNLPEFTDEMIEEINKGDKTRRQRNRCLLCKLMKLNNNRTYEVFCEALKESVNFVYLIEELNNADLKNIPKIDEVKSKEELLCEQIEKQNEVLNEIKKLPQLFDEKLEQIQNIPAFKQATPTGIKMVKDIENFSNYLFDETDSLEPHMPANKNVKLKVSNPNREIACALGIDCISDIKSPVSKKFDDYKGHILAMRNKVEKLTDDEGKELDQCISNISVYEMVGYPTVKTIADDLFDVCNFGRVVIWFAFWRRFAKNLKGPQEDRRIFGQYVGFYFYSIPIVQKWLADESGWEKLLELSKNKGKSWSDWIPCVVNLL